jgi:hypothetical protein
MDSRIRPEVIHPLEVGDERLMLSPSHDSIHVFRWLGCLIVKYFNENGGMNNVWFSIETIPEFEKHGFAIADRQFITEPEYEQYLDIRTSMLSDEEFGL